MKKRFWTIPLMAIAVACTVLLSACGGPSVEELIREDIESAFAEVSADDEGLLAAMDASSNGGFEQLGIDTKSFAAAYLEGFDYEIKDITVDEAAGTAEATVAVKMRSLSAIMADFASKFQEYIGTLDPATIGSEEELYAQAGQILMDAVSATEPSETDCSFTYERGEDNEWSATEDAETEILSAMQ